MTKILVEIIIRRRKNHRGIILLRLEDERSVNKIAVLSHLLEQYAEELPGAFVVVNESGVRVTRRK